MEKTELLKTEHIEILGNDTGVIVSPEHTFGTDAMLLADFAAPKNRSHACDLGTGCGIIPLLWARDGLCEKIYGVEIQKQASGQFERSIGINSLNEKVTSVNSDLKELDGKLCAGKFDLVTMNPPYKAENAGIKSESENEKIARHETLCNIDDICTSAARLLKFGGRFCVCIRPERLFETMNSMSRHRLEPKRLRLVVSRYNEKPWLCLIEARLGGKSGMTVEKNMIIYNKDGGYSDEMKRITAPYREG